jgi:hypothetical protein
VALIETILRGPSSVRLLQGWEAITAVAFARGSRFFELRHPRVGLHRVHDCDILRHFLYILLPDKADCIFGNRVLFLDDGGQNTKLISHKYLCIISLKVRLATYPKSTGSNFIRPLFKSTKRLDPSSFQLSQAVH